MGRPSRTAARFVNPARAGMILAPGCGPTAASGKPRASGDDPATIAQMAAWLR